MYGQLEPCQEILGGKASLGGKPLKEEEAPTESFKEIIVDKANKEISNRSIDLFFPFLGHIQSFQGVLVQQDQSGEESDHLSD